MEEKVTGPAKTPNALAFKGALVYSIYFLVLMYLFKFIGIDSGDPDAMPAGEKVISQGLSYIPFILTIVFVQTNYKKALGGYIKFGSAFSAGFKVAAYAGLFIALLTMLYYKVLDVPAYDKLMDALAGKASANAQNAQGFEKMKPYMVFFFSFGAAIFYTFFGLVVSLIDAAIIKNEKPLHFEE